WDLVRIVRLAGVAVAEHVDGVTLVPRGVRAEVTCERLQVSAGAVQEDHRLTGAGLQRPGRHTAGVHSGDAEVGTGRPGQLRPDGLGKRHIRSSSGQRCWLIRWIWVLLRASSLRSTTTSAGTARK